MYKECKAQGKAFELVFVSHDKDADEFAATFGKMPWLALPFTERDLKEKLNLLYKTRGIPSLVLLDEASICSRLLPLLIDFHVP